MAKGYEIRYASGKKGQVTYKTKGKALTSIKNTIKNNSLKQRKQVGAIGMRVVSRDLYPREVSEMKRAKNFIRN